MPPLSALRRLGKTNAPSLKTSFATYLLNWGKVSHLIPHRSTQNLVYLYDQEKQPALVQKEIVLASLSSRELPSDAITFPPRDIDTSGLPVSSDSQNKPRSGDIFLWKTVSGNVLGCWVLQTVLSRSSNGGSARVTTSAGEKAGPCVETWIRVNVRRANLRHPLGSDFQLEVNTEGVIGWVPVQIFAANSLVRDTPPPPDFENLGKMYTGLPKLRPVHLFLIRHEDSDEKNICYVRFGDPRGFHIDLKDPSVMTRPGDIYIEIQPDGTRIKGTKITPTSLLRRQLWVRSNEISCQWTKIERVNGEYQSRHVRHPVHPDYVLEPPNRRSAYPQWVFEPRDAVSDTPLPSHDIHIKDTPITLDPIPHAKGVVPPESNNPVCGQKRPAPETPGTTESEHPNGYATGTLFSISRPMKEINSKVDGVKKRKLIGVVRSVPTVAGSSKGSEERPKTKDRLPTLPRQRSSAIVDVVSPQPPAQEGSSKLSQSAAKSTTAPETHDHLKQRLDKTRKKYILQKNMAGGLRTSLLEAQELLQKQRTEARQTDVDRQAEISALVEKLQDRSQEVQRVSDEVQATKVHVLSTEQALKNGQDAYRLVTAKLEQLQKSSHDDQRQIVLLQEQHSDAKAKLDAANCELEEIRDAMDRLRREHDAEHMALFDAMNGRAVAESRVQKVEAAMKDLLRKKEEHEKISQRNASLEVELQRTKDEMERSADTAKKAQSRIAALEEICANHKRNASAVNEELSRAREELTQLRCDVKRNTKLEIELQRTKDELERSADTANKAQSQVVALEEICANHERNSSAVNEEISRAREKMTQLRCDVKRNASLDVELRRTKDEMERSADTTKRATSQVAALEEVCANHQRNASAINEELSRAREEMTQLRCDIKRNASLESELQQTKDELERSADTAKKAFSQAAALEEVCANHQWNASAVNEELSRAREEITQLRREIEHTSNLEIVLQQTKDELERSADTAEKAVSQVAALEEVCANHKRNASAVDEELSHSQEEISRLRCDIQTREEIISRETAAREDSDASLSSTKRFLEQERRGFTTALSEIQDELCTEKTRRRSSEDALEAVRRECRSPFKVPVLMDLFLEMDRRAKGEPL